MRAFDVGGLSLDFFDSSELEQEKPGDLEDNARIIARNMLRFLMMKYQGDWRDMLSSQLLKAVLVTPNPSLIRGMWHAFQEGFQHIGSQLESKRLSARQNNQAELFISNCLCIFPFANLRPNDQCKIPQLINHQWMLIEYKITPIELTPTRGIQTLFMHDEDRVFAYGLEPVGCDEAEPQLIFMGTTYPAGQGFMTQLNTDLEGFETVGNSLYRTGRERITTWLNQQNKKTHVCGTSLGGALALLLALDQGEKLSRVDALNPPGLYDAWNKSELDRWDDLEEQDKPHVFIQKQGGDFVSSVGIWKDDWNILHVIPSNAASISVLDHARNYAGYDDTTFEIVDAKQDNEARRVRNVLLYSLVRGAVYYLVVLPYHYLIRPVLLYAYEHAAQLAVLGLVFACLIPLMPLTSALLVAITPVVLHLTSKFVASSDVWMGLADLPVVKIHEDTSADIKEENNEINLEFV